MNIVEVILAAALAQGSARFNRPQAIVVDSRHDVYVADTDNNTIRKIGSDGRVTTLAGRSGVAGSADGRGDTARFNKPRGLAVDARGTIYVADTGNHVIRKISRSGEVTTFAGSPGQFGHSDGRGSEAQFYGPVALAVDISGNVWVADSSNDTIRRISPEGVVTTVAGSPRQVGSEDGVGAKARFSYPCGIAVGHDGVIVIADSGNRLIRKMTPQGAVTTVAGVVGGWDWSAAEGDVRSARFSSPMGITLDRSGNILVADPDSYTVRRISTVGAVTTLAGQPREVVPGTSPPKGAWRFREPMGIAADDLDRVYVVDPEDSTVARVSPDGSVKLVAGVRGSIGADDGLGSPEAEIRPAPSRLKFASDTSPGGRFRLWQENLSIGGHAIFARDETSGTERMLFEFPIHVDIRWLCSGRGIVVEDFGDGRKGKLLLVLLDEAAAPIDLGGELISSMDKEDREAVLASNRLRFLAFPDLHTEDELTLTVMGVGPLDPDGFVFAYSHRLGGGYTRLPQYCRRRTRSSVK